MFSNHKRFSAGMVTLLLGLGAGGIAVNAHQTESDDVASIDPVRCEIQANTSRGMTMLESVFHAEDAVNGTYTFKVVKSGPSGSSNIQQGGSFAADANEAVTLGRVSLGGGNATYDVSLSVNADGTSFSCSDHFSDSA